MHFTHGDTHWVGGAQVRVLFRSRCSSYLGTAVATSGKAAALCTTSMALLHSCRPSECDDVISRAHVSRNREQQATTALRGHRWVAPTPPSFPRMGGTKQRIKVLEQILGGKGVVTELSDLPRCKPHLPARRSASQPCLQTSSPSTAGR